MRPSQRQSNELRKVIIQRHYTKHAEGSVLVCFGDTKVICTVSLLDGVPRFLKGTNQGWLTAEYSMLPRATQQRTDREAVKGKQGGRTLEIQRLIGRSLRTCIDMNLLGEKTLAIDCDVIQADGGTRTAAVTGSCVALYDAMSIIQQKLKLKTSPFKQFISAVSVGVYQGTPILDLNYIEDSAADTDMNVIMNEKGEFIEIQGTAEKTAFHKNHLDTMLSLAQEGAMQLIQIQRAAIGITG